jgi:hypothetical protein
MLTTQQKDKLKAQWGRRDDLEQYAIVHLQDPETCWDWYLLNMSPDEEIYWGIVRGVDLTIEAFSADIIHDINFIFSDGIHVIPDFLPTKANHIWKKLQTLHNIQCNFQ